MAAKYTYLTPYSYAGNKPITHKDIDGMEGSGDKPSSTPASSSPSGIKAGTTTKDGVETTTNIFLQPGPKGAAEVYHIVTVSKVKVGDKIEIHKSVTIETKSASGQITSVHDDPKNNPVWVIDAHAEEKSTSPQLNAVSDDSTSNEQKSSHSKRATLTSSSSTTTKAPSAKKSAAGSTTSSKSASTPSEAKTTSPKNDSPTPQPQSTGEKPAIQDGVSKAIHLALESLTFVFKKADAIAKYAGIVEDLLHKWATRFEVGNIALSAADFLVTIFTKGLSMDAVKKFVIDAGRSIIGVAMKTTIPILAALSAVYAGASLAYSIYETIHEELAKHNIKEAAVVVH